MSDRPSRAKSMEREVVIVGAGLAGLTAARYLEKADFDVLVLESSERPGGRMKSDYIDGFVLDHGFQVINPKYPEVIAADIIDSSEFIHLPAGFRVIDGETSARYSIASAVTSPGSLREKFAFLQFLSTHAVNSESLGQKAVNFQKLYAQLLQPFLRGVFLTEPSNISADAAQKILRSFISGRPGVPSKGVGVFSSLLASKVSNIRYQSVVQEISEGRVITDNESIGADFVIVATDPTTAHQLIQGRTIPEVLPSTTWYHVTQGELRNSDLLAAQRTGGVINSVVMSKLAPTYAPIGQTLIASTTLGAISESDVRRELSKIWEISTHDWQLLAKYEIKQSLPMHGVGQPLYSKQRITNSLYLAGDHCTYPSQQGAMESGRLVAEEIIRRVALKR